jgi:Uma2 family endonuclease
MELALGATTTLKRWRVEEYHRMATSGLLRSDERTELLAGQVVLMAAKGTPHVLALRLLAQGFDTYLRDLPFFVSTQDPIRLNDFSEPEPDLAIARGSMLDYAAQHPTPADVVLVVEVADTTVKTDCEVKDKLYGGAGIADYWVLDVQNRCLHVFRQPSAAGYAHHLILAEPSMVRPLAFPDCELGLTAMLPPRG